MHDRDLTAEDFYPRPPRGGRQLYKTLGLIYEQFLPTPSARRATSEIDASPRTPYISTHALREEGDLFGIQGGAAGSMISTHALREEGDLA